MNTIEFGKFARYRKSVAIYPLSEGRGLPHDFSLNRYNATKSSGIIWCKCGMRCNGLDTYFFVDNFPNLSKFMVILGVRVKEWRNWRYVIAKAVGASFATGWTGWRHNLGVGGNATYFDLSESNLNYKRIGDGSINTGCFVVETLWWDGSTMRLYHNYILKAEGSFTGDISNTLPLAVGANSDSVGLFIGQISMVQIFNDVDETARREAVYHIKRNVKPTAVTRRGVYTSVRNTGIEVDGNMMRCAEAMV